MGLAIIILSLISSKLYAKPCEPQVASIDSISRISEEMATPPADIEKIFRHWQSVAQCSERTWPNFNSKIPLVIFDSDRNVGWALEPNGNVKSMTEKEVKQAVQKIPGWKIAKWKGKPAFFMDRSNLVATTNEYLNFRIVYHEYFHEAEHDSSWNYRPSGERFGTNWPMECSENGQFAGRFVRADLSKELQLAVKAETPDKRAQHLSRARYWNDIYNKRFSKEIERYAAYDQIEGSARYADAVASAIAQNPALCKASETEFNRAVLEEAKKEPPIYLSITPDQESYPIGLFVGALTNSSDPNWKKRMKEGKDVTSELLAPYAPLASNTDPSYRKTCQMHVEDRKRFDDGNVEVFQAALASKDMVVVSLPNKLVPGTSEVRNGGTYNNIVSGSNFHARNDQSLAGSKGTLELKNTPVFDGSDKCGRDRVRVLVPRSYVERVQKSGKAETYSSGNSKITLQGDPREADQLLGKPVFCL